MQLLILKNLPFTFVEDPLFRKHSKLEDMSVDTFMKYMKLVTAKVEEKISLNLP
jgi:hypothetical protein